MKKNLDYTIKLKNKLHKKRDKKIQNSNEFKQKGKNNLPKDNSYMKKIEEVSNTKKIKEEANIQAKEKKDIEIKLINNDSDCATKKCGVNVELMKNENINVNDQL